MSANQNIFFTMKKLIFASIVMLATMTACQNSESTVNPEEQQHQTFQSKTTAREGEELPPLSPEQEKAMIEDAVANLKENRESELKELQVNGRYASNILCHTAYSDDFGHACVWSNGYLVEVTWTPVIHPNGNYFPGMNEPVYGGHIVPRCNC